MEWFQWKSVVAGLGIALAIYTVYTTHLRIESGVQANQILGYYIQTGALPPLPRAPQGPSEAPERPSTPSEDPEVTEDP